MIIGHLGIAAALGALLRAPIRTGRLIALCAAAFAPDVVDGLLVLVGECNPVGLYSHTIPVVALEAAIVGGLALLLTNSRATAALFATLVVLHPVGDFFTGSKLLLPGGDVHGLNLYDRPLIDFLLSLQQHGFVVGHAKQPTFYRISLSGMTRGGRFHERGLQGFRRPLRVAQHPGQECPQFNRVPGIQFRDFRRV